jgi:hypothetical protein
VITFSDEVRSPSHQVKKAIIEKYQARINIESELLEKSSICSLYFVINRKRMSRLQFPIRSQINLGG